MADITDSIPEKEHVENCEVVNFARPDNYQFTIFGRERLSFLCKSVTLPDVSINEAPAPFVGIDAKLHGDKLIISDLEIEFLLESNVRSYVKLMNGITRAVPYEDPSEFQEEYTRAVLSQFDDGGSVVMTYVMMGVFPKTVSGYRLEAGGPPDPMLITATFAVNGMYIDDSHDGS